MPRHVVILGAGISGLAAAWHLKQQDPTIKLTLIEKTGRAGGWISTKRIGNYLFEQGPRGCRSYGSGRHTLALCEQLELQDQLISAHPHACCRFLYDRQQLQRFPPWYKLPFSALMRGWTKALYQDLKAPVGVRDESVHDFFARRIGPDWTARFIAPLVSGIYAGDITQLSIRSTFPELWGNEQTSGSLLKGMFKKRPSPHTHQSPFMERFVKTPLFAFKDGMETLTQAFLSRFDGQCYWNTSATSLTMTQDHITVHLTNGQKIEADSVYSSLPAYAVAPLLHTHAPTLATQLSSLPYATIRVINLGYEKKVLTKEGFGYLVPPIENQPILGCVWDSSFFPQQNTAPSQTRLTVMMGGTLNPNILNESESDSLSTALTALEKHLNITCEPTVVNITTAKQAIPQYPVGHQALSAEIKAFNESHRLHIGGTIHGGVSVNDAIFNGMSLNF